MKTRLRVHLTLLLLAIFPATIFCQVNWISQTSGTNANLYAVRFLDANNGYACGDAGTVIKTIDGGLTWTSVNIATTIPVTDIFFTSTSEGWAAVGDENNSGTSGQIWHTTNGGTNWTQQTPSTTEARLGICFANSTTGWVVGSRNGALNIDATTNGGSAWANQSDANIFGWTYKIDALSSTTAFAIGGAFFPSVTGFIIKTTNGGTNWTQLSTGTIPFMNGLDMFDATTGFTVGDGGSILTTTNGGTSWTAQVSGTTDTLQAVSFKSANTGWAVGFLGTIRRTINGGTTWTIENSGITNNLNGICSIDTTTAWAVGANGKIIKRMLGTGIYSGTFANLDVTVFPNPFSSSTTISLHGYSGEQTFSLSVYDLEGREVKRLEGIESSEIVLSAENLSAGLYHFSLLTKDNSIVARGKLIVN